MNLKCSCQRCGVCEDYNVWWQINATSIPCTSKLGVQLTRHYLPEYDYKY